MFWKINPHNNRSQRVVTLVWVLTVTNCQIVTTPLHGYCVSALHFLFPLCTNCKHCIIQIETFLQVNTVLLLTIACVASVSSRGSSRKLGQERKKHWKRLLRRLYLLVSAWLFIWQPAIRTLWHVPLGYTVTPNSFRRHFVIRQQYTHFTHFIIINNLHLHDRGSIGSLTSVRLTLGVHSMANSVKNTGAVTRVGRNAQAEEPCMLERFSRSDWLKWLPLSIGGCGGLRTTDVTDSGLIICSRHSGKKHEGVLGRERGYLHFVPHSTIWTAFGTGNKVWAMIELSKLVIPKKLPRQQNS